MPKIKYGITYYNTSEAAKLIGRSKRTILEHIYKKHIKDVTLNDIRHREWVEDDINRFSKYFRELSIQRENIRSKKEKK